MGPLRFLGKSLIQCHRCTPVMRAMAQPMASRMMSNDTSNLVQLSVNDQTGIATFKLNRKPVNSLSHEMLTEMVINLQKIQNDKSIKGAIFTSKNPGVFSAGLDIMEFFKSKDALGEFWRALQDMWIHLYGLNIPTIAAINGHAPAGGCLIALSCDYRIMAEGKYQIGLNETKLGIVAPWWFIETLRVTAGQRVSEYALQLGQMYDTTTALNVGIIDKVVDQAQVYETAEKELAQWLKIPAVPRIITKQYFRKPLIDKLQNGRDADIKTFVDYMTRNSVQKMLHEYVANLKKKSEAKQ